jgi:hypothetical protein
MMQRLTCLLIAGVPLLLAQTGAPTTFATPEEARDALVQAAKSGLDAVRTLFGPGAADVVRTGDDVQDKIVLERFNRLAAEKAQLEPDPMNPDRISLALGVVEWPFAIPLVRKNGRWFFDIKEGKAEIRRRVIGGNELDAIQVCRGFVEAQQIYARTDWQGAGVLQYARKIFSAPGKKDGLYWPGDDSPVAEAFARAVAEGYTQGSTPKPFHGYYFKMLMRQGPAAIGGEMEYLVHSLMIGGYALIAWPADYGVSGIKTFIVNQDGVVYEKDLGPQTSPLAKAITRFNPDKSWDVVPDDDDANSQ